MVTGVLGVVEVVLLTSCLADLGADPPLEISWIDCTDCAMSYRISTISVCKISVSTGTEKGAIIPTHGIRQGDPLSPSLFILCSQALAAVITAVENDDQIQGIRVRNRGLPRPLLQGLGPGDKFVEVDLDILPQYPQQVQEVVLLGQNFETPTRLEAESIVPCKQRGVAKSVVLSMSTFASSHFKLPTSFHSLVRKAAMNFYWGDSTEKKKIHWVSWARLCRLEQQGGLEFKDPKLHNQALLSKLAWRLWSSPETYWAKMMKAIYYPKTNFLDAKAGNQSSWAWHNVLEGRKVLIAVPSGILVNVTTSEFGRIVGYQRRQHGGCDRKDPVIIHESWFQI
ncbi:uncharacterized protein LOC122662899 [Telopea speciosissima]|uniref:uncharacterized protein LOC122662899 n=1 Tax=Telopea speciosissima TaxID=54955 RepID=UPI001CC7A786|nr:uncharacterized protein LOC122662899 [Telopea speciosissima]